ncbi:MAG: DNA replication and repair protein RecF [Bacilli bacterium]|nr:DNA replication and repair protein RecF [Bacilli bacterium]
MIIQELTLRQFRNHSYLKINFEKGINAIVGSNGIGKTNIVEAIYFLSYGRSFRTENEMDMIQENQEFASIEGVFKNDDDETKKIKVVITRSGKKITYNGVELKKVSELTSLTNIISFKPSDVMLFDNAPHYRRRFIDLCIMKFDANYTILMTNYNNLLKERNEILKLEKINEIQLDIITEQMIDIEFEIVKKRKSFIAELNSIAKRVLFDLKGEETEVLIKYRSFVDCDASLFKERAKKAYFDNLERDLKTRSTNIGVQREDFSTLVNNRDIEVYGSQGQKRQLSLALSLCPYFVYKDKDRKPIVILDDVLSELDYSNQKRLIEFVGHMNQTFITSTEFKYKCSTYHEVGHHKVTRR